MGNMSTIEKFSFEMIYTVVGANAFDVITGGDKDSAGTYLDEIILEPAIDCVTRRNRLNGFTSLLLEVHNPGSLTALGDFQLLVKAHKDSAPVVWMTGSTWATVAGVLKHKTANLNTTAAASEAVALIDIGPVYSIGFEAKSGGSTVLANGTFTGNANSWTLGAGWAYNATGGGCVAATTASTTLKQLKADMGTQWTSGQVYEVKFTLSSVSAGSITVGTNTNPAQGGISFDADGTYTGKITSDGHADGLVFTGTGFTGIIDSVTLIHCPPINVRGSLFR